ncbi:single-stranded-DNA-specific exonuclease RecJ [Rhodoblastus acidophilus]|uniref:Single-stranded-DNA-specific exonuclease RecJ n=1 Tax=Candidatus Rhodoblastus alkanivorans TaxID=2954117 RepID=A0ABS9Z6Z6_9HYPH|nr:single-stranded-DNA-specific exonuclease RecJ [Candidatus Rhodoblastus alkanivorans]MCI4680724.1 single-stranded-DNA-specific exonuclease RecJ [Candidatus Rhodoblastus alkanivorans]MCI4683367.1 single-stranded-DNA-specific exonuclease RecJ [Candidatus Rhodoblastus alkanivorans]MDI4640679.1 single-stranded-DNA-specific exonuclease RecJ [Rhodoblastus acidophilus]
MAFDRRVLLGVESSVLGRPWRSRLDAAGDARALAIAQQTGLPDLLSRVLAGRGVAPETALGYLDPTLRMLLPEPFSLTAMQEATERLVRAVERQETIAIFGDYDVDGACSSALLAEFFDYCGVPRLIHIPDRITEGYGPNAEAIRALAARGATLLVTADCGTTSHEPFAEARRLGMDVVVLDHHQAPEVLPEAIVVNPNRQDDVSGQGALCAAGVAFVALVALNRALRQRGFWRERLEPDLLRSLDLVALATVADVAPLTGLNRAFVVKGLALMKSRGRAGLRALADVAGVNGPPRAFHLGFLLGPRINAGGRIGDAALGAKLLLLSDELEAAAIAAELDRLNGERQILEKQMLQEALAEAYKQLGPAEQGAVVLTAGEDWLPGIVGLVAARLKELFGRPAFALALDGDVATGSARSIQGVDLGRAVRAAVERGLIVKGGGHAMAAGVTLRRDQIEGFQSFLEEMLAEPVARARAEAGLAVDGLLTASACAPALVEEIEKAGPFGSANPEPVFALPEHRINDVQPFGADHLRLRVQAGDGARMEIAAFRVAQSPLGAALAKGRGERAHLACSLTLDHWGGRTKVSARLVDLAFCKPGAGG